MKYRKINLAYIKDIEARNNIKNFAENIVNIRPGEIITSRFLNPYEQKIVGDIADKEHLFSIFKGGNIDSERKVSIVSDDEDLLEYINPIQVLYCEIDTEGIKHPDVLGSILNLGIDRSTIGDIVIKKDRIEFACLEEISDFLLFNLKRIRKRNLSFNIKDDGILDFDKIEYIELIRVLSSLRLDNFVSNACNISRADGKKLIQREKVKVDFRKEINPSYEITEGSMISISSYGRFIFDEVISRTNKDKYRIRILKVK
mgnify:CR=1 FL=1